MSHDEELERAMHKIGALRYELELLQSENKLVREESDRHYQLWVDSKADLEKSDGAVWTLLVENARLKAEVESVRQVAQDNKTETEATRIENASLNNYIERLEVRNAELVPENASLKAEVERLTSNLLGRDATIMGLDSTIKCREADVENFKEYLKWHADGHKFNAWEIWRRQKSDAKEGKPSEQKSPSFIEDLGNGVEKHDLLFRYPAKEGKQS